MKVRTVCFEIDMSVVGTVKCSRPDKVRSG